MEACVIVCRTQKPPERRGRVLFIDAVNEVVRERAQSLLTTRNQARILDAYRAFTDEPGFAAIASADEILGLDGSLAIPRYVHPAHVVGSGDQMDLATAWASFEESGRVFWLQMDELIASLDQSVLGEEQAGA